MGSLSIKYAPLGELVRHERNPKAHDVETIAQSIARFGFVEPVVIDERTGKLASGHGRLTALETLRERHDDDPDAVPVPEGVRVKGSTWLVPRVVGYASADDHEASAVLIALNRAGERGGWVDDALLELLDTLSDVDDGFAGVGFDQHDLDSLRQRLAIIEQGGERAEEIAEGKARAARVRALPLDLILSINAGPSFAEAQMGYRLGWQAGVMSSHAHAARAYFARYPRAPRLAFMDNEWHGYDHAQHVAAVAEFRPKYATTRDLLTREQAEQEGVEWYSVEETLEMAAEVDEHVDHTILIPKYDCLDQLPEEYVLGYSVPSSYGGTPLPIEAFRGRRVHLLGGPWSTQRAFLNLLGDDVVSLDNNNVMMVARFGQVCMPDGTSVLIDDLLGHSVGRSFFPALTLSLANIATAVEQEYGVQVDPLSNNDPDERDVDELLDELGELGQLDGR